MKRIWLALALLGMTLSAHAQGLDRTVSGISYEDTDIRTVLREIASRYSFSYSITPELQGKVTVTIQRATLEEALLKILMPLDATFSVEAGVVRAQPEVQLEGNVFLQKSRHEVSFDNVEPRAAAEKVFSGFGRRYWLDKNVQRRVTLHLSDASFQQAMSEYLDRINGVVWRVEGVYKVRSRTDSEPSRRENGSIYLDESDADVREVLRKLFRKVDISYSIAPDIQGNVTVSLKNVTFETALQNVLKQVEATYRVEGGVYQIVSRN